MNFLGNLKAEMDRKRKQIADADIEYEGKKYYKRGDLAAKKEQEYLEKLQKKRDDAIEVSLASGSGDSVSKVKPEHAVVKADHKVLPMDEIRRRLRARGEPILLFGETEAEVRERLLQKQLEQPEMKEGLKNEMQSAMQDVDNELMKEVIEGSSGEAGKHDVALPESYQDSWEKIEQDAALLGIGDNAARDCDTILAFFKYLLAKWAKILNQRDDEIKKSNTGKLEASIQKQTATNLKPLLTSLENHTCNNDIRHHLVKIGRLLILDRNYILANNAYMQMAIGNAPWPVGVTRSGIHQRPGSAKSYVSNIAHVLNDETQRKYVQAIKRLMTRMQEYFPTDPSKCVEFVRPI